MEFGDYISNHHEICIQISTNMPAIGLEMCKIVENFEKQNHFVWMVKPMAACTVITLRQKHHGENR